MGNSVIYRPAYDAEVEYLESTGTQWIDTGISLSNYDGFEICYSPTQASTFVGNSEVIGSRNPEDSAVVLGFNANDSTTRNIGCKVYIRWGTLAISANPSSIASIGEWYTANVNVSNRMASDGLGNSVTLDDIPQSTNSLFIFAGRQTTTGIVYANVKIAYCKFYSNSILVRDFIPVRIGQVGYMYDKVTKQLFANKGTGNFVLGNDVSNAVIPQQRCVLYFGSQRSVIYERIYEEYEWLCGRYGAYIDTEYHPAVGTDRFSVHFRYDGTIRNPDGKEQDVFGERDLHNNYIRAYINTSNYLSCNYYHYVDSFPSTSKYSAEWILENLRLDGSLFKYTANEVDYSNSNNDMRLQELDTSMYLFNCNNLNGYYFHGDIKSFKITTSSDIKMDLIPCKLLQSIPAILDGNGIARQAGECGMWDKVNNKFYGNVANSGTFTVKGAKCYEEYDWLVATIPVGVLMMSLPLDSYNFYYQMIWQVFGNVAYFQTEGHTYFTLQSNRQVSIYDISTRQSYTYYSYPKIEAGELMTIDSNSTRTLIHNVEVERYAGESTTFIKFQNAGNGVNTAEYSTSSITVDGSVRYVPCKLTHGIPASMDANGIARPAGECGMWDKVNDKFYGNVANSGTFTVSND